MHGKEPDRHKAGRRSGGRPTFRVWHVWTKRGQVYVAHKGGGGIQKISLHTPTNCRHAFTSEYGKPTGLQTRAIVEWERAPTPPVGIGRASCALTLEFPTDFLSTALDHVDGVTWVPAAPAGHVTIMEFIFTEDNEHDFRAALTGPRREVLYWRTCDNEAFVIISHFTAWVGENITVPPSHDETRRLVISSDDPNRTGRPIRFSVFGNPKNGVMTILEFGANWQDINDPVPNPSGTFTRQSIFVQTKGWGRPKSSTP